MINVKNNNYIKKKFYLHQKSIWLHQKYPWLHKKNIKPVYYKDLNVGDTFIYPWAKDGDKYTIYIKIKKIFYKYNFESSITNISYDCVSIDGQLDSFLPEDEVYLVDCIALATLKNCKPQLC